MNYKSEQRQAIKKAKDSGVAFDISHWQKASKYTDDSALTNFVNGDYADTISALEGQLDKKAETWYQSNDPATAWTTTTLKESHLGDLWIKSDVTNSSNGYVYKKTNSTYGWVDINGIPQEMVNTIQAKANIYVTMPTSPKMGDLLIPTSNTDRDKSRYYRRYD